ncbi:uncharacterized protein K452DRAFT_225392 [Aplosporella prunicola CBS 121167]|uniref:L-dopachrome isomerase n=1 Tax=Aplosporella prunicola CBS 121167 TaxID=1176127 RepID=A0A6A6BH15_9PEZI|nr:uncharacterized protein K452DRAFT_225392 [Aplosporella prunicola CBS 121167]KAF2143442.1 hypothetical protein K452DRAFT_225392 [Aplosporella prunicola CBS 121167]
MFNERQSTSTMESNDQFPKQAGATLIIQDGNPKSPLSPADSTLSFDDALVSPRAFAPLPEPETLADRKEIIRTIEWGAPGEKKEAAVTKGISHGHKTRKRTQYYEGRFNERDTTGQARDRVARDSPVVVELKTNVIIDDEYTLATSLSNQLSRRFQRSESSIMVNLNHSACLLFGGTFEPAYVLHITALPSQLQPVTNKRNAALLQEFLRDILTVEPERGIVQFHALAEENFAINSHTLLGEVEQEERKMSEQSGVRLAMTKGAKKSRSLKPKVSMQLMRKNSIKSSKTLVAPSVSSPGTLDSPNTLVDLAGDDLELSQVDSKNNDKLAQLQTRQTASQSVSMASPPPTPEDTKKPKVGKSKSLAAIFRR